PSDTIARFARAHKVRDRTIDGNDVLQVARVAGEMVDGMRNGEGPAFLELITYRWRGHVGPDENIDVGVRRSADDVAAWKKRDPIARLMDGALEREDFSKADFDVIASEIDREMTAGISAARESRYPDPEQNQSSLYFGGGANG
ncbi:MAG: hypothetical protein KDI36_18630, partial [Pseudomonadales bacterium]|nr:hypothetical protein [Pseudomonadales bacterium]